MLLQLQNINAVWFTKIVDSFFLSYFSIDVKTVVHFFAVYNFTYCEMNEINKSEKYEIQVDLLFFVKALCKI